MRSVARLAAFTVIAAILLTGCGAGTDAPAHEDIAWVADVVPNLGEVLDEIPEGQAAALRDGGLTFEELEAAKLNEIRCASDGGHPLTGNLSYDPATLSFDYQLAGAPPEGVQQMAETLQRCHVEHFAYVSAIWQELHRPTVEEQQAANAAMSDCLRAAGVEGFPEPGNVAFRQWMDAQSVAGPGSYAEEIDTCMEEVLREHGIPPN